MEIRKGRSVGSTGVGNLEGEGREGCYRSSAALLAMRVGIGSGGLRGKRRSADRLLGFPNLVIIFGK